jgi:hypothetical protein
MRTPSGVLFRWPKLAEIQVVGIATADDGVSDVTHQGVVLAAFVVGTALAEQIGVVGPAGFVSLFVWADLDGAQQADSRFKDYVREGSG